jgi:peptidoglycan/LPS O-acetylase OafA/YrhL
MYAASLKGDIADVASSAEAADTGRTWSKPYYMSFNGLRGFAVLLVFLHHFEQYFHSIVFFQRVGWMGVDLFFVLSGFLITGILYDSLDGTNFFRSFYVRRALRIFPIFYGFFLLVFLLTPVIHLEYSRWMLTFFFYVGNLVEPFMTASGPNPTFIFVRLWGHFGPFINIGHLWSLCVEEQFYLVWPAILWLVKDRRRLMQLCVALSVGVLILRCYLVTHASEVRLEHFLIYWSTYTRFDTLLAGAWLALWLRGTKLTSVQLRRIARALFFVGAIVVGALLYRLPKDEIVFADHKMMGFGLTFIALAAAGILLYSLDESSVVSRVVRWGPLSRLGVISYGFYFFHNLGLGFWKQIASTHPRFSPLIPVAVFALTYATAWISFHYYETPFLKLKKYFPEPKRAA